jgi:hypothetical protein
MNSNQILFIEINLLIASLASIISIVSSILSLFRKPKQTSQVINIYESIEKEINAIIMNKCRVAYEKIIEPLIVKPLHGIQLVNDSVVNKITLQITNEILEELSEDYLEKLFKIYKSEKIKDILLEKVYNEVTRLSLQINKEALRKSWQLVKGHFGIVSTNLIIWGLGVMLVSMACNWLGLLGQLVRIVLPILSLAFTYELYLSLKKVFQSPETPLALSQPENTTIPLEPPSSVQN